MKKTIIWIEAIGYILLNVAWFTGLISLAISKDPTEAIKALGILVTSTLFINAYSNRH